MHEKNGTIEYINQYEVLLLKQATKYYIQFEAIDAKGRPGPPVPSRTDPLSFTTNPASITALAIDETFAKDGLLMVNWTSAVGNFDYYEVEIFDAMSNIESKADRLKLDIIPRGDPAYFNPITGRYKYKIDMNDQGAEFKPDTDYRVVIYSVLNTDDNQLKSAPMDYLWSLPRE